MELNQNGHMTSVDDRQYFVPAWGISLAVHGLAVGLAVAFAAQVKPLLPEDVFNWDVALVEGTKPDSKLEQVESIVPPAQPPAKKTLPPQPKHVVEASPSVTQVEQKSEPPQPIIETVQPIEPKVEAPQLHHDVVEERVVALAAPNTEPVEETTMLEPVAATASTEPMTSASVSPADVPIVQETAVSAPAQASPANAAPVMGHEAKADNRWLAESLWRRVAELKRYPSLARLNGQEGKVILKAVIRSDGQLADVFVQKSSGYSALDEAAMEAVRLACPLHMRHAIGKSQIVVSLPIVYSLAN